MNYPENLRYTKTHEWVKQLDNGNLRIGLSDYAQESMGAIVFVNLPEPGSGVTAGVAFADVESVKAVAEAYSPADGSVVAVNERLLDQPQDINDAPYEAWLIEVAGTAPDGLLSAAEYEKFIAETEGE